MDSGKCSYKEDSDRINSWNEEFQKILNSQNPNGWLTYIFVRKILRQSQLDRSYDEADILNEAYLRGVKRIQEGKVIYNVSAWLRSTAINIVRELARSEQKSVSWEFDSPAQLTQEPTEDWSEKAADDIIALQMALQSLDPLEQKILKLRIIDELSWCEIQSILRIEGRGDFTEVALRKKKERVLSRLRKNYHALKSSNWGSEMGSARS